MSINSLDQLIGALNAADRVIFGLALLALLGAVAAHRLPRFKLPRISPLFIILILAFALRIPGLSESFWYDETFSAAMASLSLDDLGAAMVSDVHPPLYYLVLWGVAQIAGTSELALRAPALLAGMASILMTYHLTYKLFNRQHTAALIAAFIMAILPAHIRYSAEARGYMLLVLLVQIGLYANITRNRVLFALALVGLPLTHNLGYIYAAALAAGGWMVKRLRPALLLSLVPSGVWLPAMLLQSQDVANGFWLNELIPQGIIRPLATMTVGGHSIASIFISIPGVFILTYVGVLVARRWVKRRDGWAWLFVALGVPVLTAIASWVWKPVYLDRALLPAMLLVVPAWAAAIQVRRPMQWVAVIALGVGLVAYLSADRPDYRAWVAACDGPAIYVRSTATGIISQYYSGGRTVYIDSDSNDLAQWLPDHTKALFGLVIVDDMPDGDLCMPVQMTPYNKKPSLAQIMQGDTLLTFYDDDPFIFATFEVRHYD